MTTRPMFLSCLFLVAAAACARFEVRTVQDPSIDFTRFRTFAWMPLDVAFAADQRLQERSLERVVRSGVERGLLTKGYAAADVAEADLFVTYRLTSADRQASGVPAGYAGERLWTRRKDGSDSYERGSLVVDLFDRAGRRLVWRGSASARLLPHQSYEYRLERATKAVDEIMLGVPARLEHAWGR